MELDSPEIQDLEERLASIVKARPAPSREGVVEAMSRVVMAETAWSEAPVRIAVKHAYLRKWATYFATALVLIGVGYPVISKVSKTHRTDSRTYTTAAGQRASITLKDGSSVTLAPATTLRISGRTVELKGEAFFTVNHATQPFIVRTADVQARVLGTQFSVRRYSDDVYASVSVVNGKVAVAANTANQSERVISADQTAQVANKSVQVVVSNPNTLSWLNGRMVFDDMLLPEVLHELERWYNAKFVIGDSALTNEVVHAEVGPESLNDAVKILASALNAKVVRTGQTITFFKR